MARDWSACPCVGGVGAWCEPCGKLIAYIDKAVKAWQEGEVADRMGRNSRRREMGDTYDSRFRMAKRRKKLAG